MATRTITALFDQNSEAQRAEERLIDAGVARSNINIIAQNAGSGTASTGSSTGASASDDGGFFGALRDLFLPEEDQHTYAEGIRRGGFLLTAKVDEQILDQAIDILDDNGSVDLDSRESEWRTGGWTGYQGASTSGGSSGFGAGAQGTTQSTGYAATGGSGIPSTRGSSEFSGTQTARGTDQEETLKVAEERLSVGKREVNRGGVRVRSYVTEQPVSEQVNLREERVSVERRPVNQTLGATNADNLFQERTIDMTETSEEAVVAKQAVVTEEIGLRKEATQRTETVHDTVRKTQVEVDDDVAETRGTGTLGTGTDDKTRFRSGSGT